MLNYLDLKKINIIYKFKLKIPKLNQKCLKYSKFALIF